MRFVRIATLSAGCAVLLAGTASAQRVSGTVVEAGAAVPIQGAMVVLVTGSGAPQASGLTDDAGRFAFLASRPGRYSLRVERIGFRNVETPPFDLAAGEHVMREIVVAAEPVRLEGITAEATRRCVSHPAGDAAVAMLWEEARKALEVAAYTERQGLYRFVVLNWQRELDAGSLRVRREEARPRVSWANGSPFVSAPGERLLRDGFVLPSDTATDYFAPDAHVLLSDAFLDEYCFRVVAPSSGEPDLIGLGFEPESPAGAPAVKGTLWLDRATSRLRFLEHGYVRVRFPDGPTRHIGGRVEFEALANGTWIVRRWRIRMPVPEHSPSARRPSAGRAMGRIAWLLEQGGEVLEVRDVSGGAAPLLPRR